MSGKRVEPGSVEELLAELRPDPPADWILRGDFDPMSGASELRLAAKRGLIELHVEAEPDAWRFRLTGAGRAALKDGA